MQVACKCGSNSVEEPTSCSCLNQLRSPAFSGLAERMNAGLRAMGCWPVVCQLAHEMVREGTIVSGVGLCPGIHWSVQERERERERVRSGQGSTGQTDHPKRSPSCLHWRESSGVAAGKGLEFGENSQRPLSLGTAVSASGRTPRGERGPGNGCSSLIHSALVDFYTRDHHPVEHTIAHSPIADRDRL